MARFVTRLVLSFFLFSSCVFAETVTITGCNCTDDAANLRQAISTATNGGAVPGTVLLNGMFQIPSGINIQVPNLTLEAGPSGATLDNSTRGSAALFVLAGADGLTVRGLTFHGRQGIMVQSAAPIRDLSFVYNTFLERTTGILDDYTKPPSTGWNVRNNVFACPNDLGCVPSVVGVLVSGTKGDIRNNTFQYSSMGTGIWIQQPQTQDGGSDWSVQDNDIDADLAIFVGGSSNLIANNRTMTPGTYGVIVGLLMDPITGSWFTPAAMNKITNNHLSSKAAAIWIEASTSSNSVLTNEIDSSSIGISLGDQNESITITNPSTDNQIHANAISGGDIAIFLAGLAVDNIVTGNRISTDVPPVKGIVQETTNANLVRGNPGFDPMTGTAAVHGPGGLKARNSE